MSDTLLTEVEGRVLVITLNRPDVRNALNGELTEGILAARDRLDNDDDLAVGVLAGAGSGFCAGMDLKAFAAEGVPKGLDRLLRRRTHKPIVAAVEGFAFAGGLELVLTADLIVAARGAKFGISEVKMGLFAAGGGLLRLPRQMPPRLAMELALTGDSFDADRALAAGLINQVVEVGQSRTAAVELATKIASNAPLSVARSKFLIEASQNVSEEEYWRIQTPLWFEVLKSADAKEGPRAFAERRTPAWTGQ